MGAGPSGWWLELGKLQYFVRCMAGNNHHAWMQHGDVWRLPFTIPQSFQLLQLSQSFLRMPKRHSVLVDVGMLRDPWSCTELQWCIHVLCSSVLHKSSQPYNKPARLMLKHCAPHAWSLQCRTSQSRCVTELLACFVFGSHFRVCASDRCVFIGPVSAWCRQDHSKRWRVSIPFGFGRIPWLKIPPQVGHWGNHGASHCGGTGSASAAGAWPHWWSGQVLSEATCSGNRQEKVGACVWRIVARLENEERGWRS